MCDCPEIQVGPPGCLLCLVGAGFPRPRPAEGIPAAAQDQVLVASFQGKKFADHLEAEPSSVTQQMSRALVNMWVRRPVPQVLLYSKGAEVWQTLPPSKEAPVSPQMPEGDMRLAA